MTRKIKYLSASFFIVSWLLIFAPSLANANEPPAPSEQVVSEPAPIVNVLVTNGGDDTSYRIPITVPVLFNGVPYTNIFATTNSVITFGQPDNTFHTYPNTPSISIESRDWWALPRHMPDTHFIIRTSEGGFQVDGSYRPYGSMQGPTTQIVITAQIQTNGEVTYTYTVEGPLLGDERTGVRLQNGTVVSLEQAGITQSEEPVVLAPEPVSGPTPEEIAAEAARIAAEAAAAQAEADRIAAEQAAAEAAEAARIAAEAAAAQAEADRIAAEQAAAEAAAAQAEANRIAAEAAQQAYEAEQVRIKAESDAKAAEDLKIKIEAERKAAAEAAAKAEAERIAAEEAAKKAEEDRISAELAAAKAKAEAEKAEADRLEAEAKAKAAEEAKAKEELEVKIKAEQEAKSLAEKKAAEEAKAKEEADELKAKTEAAKAEEERLAKIAEDAKKGIELSKEEISVVVAALVENLKPGESISAAQVQASGVSFADLPPETPIQLRTSESGEVLIITAEVAANVELVQDPGALLEAVFTDPGAALAALGSIGADMTTEEREEATDMVIATVVATGAAINAAAVAAGGAAGGGTGGGGNSGGSSSGANSPGSRGGRKW